MSPVIETTGLRKAFDEHVAIEGLDLTVERGDVFGLLGPNGAGKTTTIRMLTTLLAPDAGAARVCGFDVSTQPSEVRRRIGYVMQRVAYRGLLTGRECVEIEAALYHLPRREIPVLAEGALDAVGMLPHADRRWATYSGGMQKRLDLACGLLHSPEVLVLDEPSLGLDVQSRHNVWEFVGDRRLGGATVLLATNYLDEADRLCNKVAIIDHGRVVVQGSPSELKRAVGADVVEVATPEPERLRRVIEMERWVRKIVIGDLGDLHIFVEDAAVALPAVMGTGLEHGIGLERMTYSQPSLDDVFLLHTGRELREAGVAS
ncbi:MAG: ATP-binding cassette domain-containing protein [Actinomycetota bacterium]|nr:ATP-binding cassette domain-containing protein [Actinomycetota bacterium]